MTAKMLQNYCIFIFLSKESYMIDQKQINIYVQWKKYLCEARTSASLVNFFKIILWKKHFFFQ